MRLVIFQIRDLRMRPFILRMPISQNRCALLRGMLWAGEE